MSKKQVSAVLPGANFDPIVIGGSGSAGSKLHGEDRLEEVFGEEVAAQVGSLMMVMWSSVHFWLLHYLCSVK